MKNLKLKINSIGSKENREEYANKLKEYFSKFKDKLTSTSKKRLSYNPLRILDTKIDFEIELVKKAPKIIDYISKKHFESMLAILDNLNIPYTIDDYLVRGLDYYSRTIFEIQANSLGSQNALCGGGRYDYLVEELGGPYTPAIGFAAGLERLIMAMNINNNEIIKNPNIYIISIGDEAIEFSLKLANQLRLKKNLIIINDTLRRSLKAQMKDANRLNTKYSIIIGEEELSKKTVSIKNMETGNQEELPIDKIIDYF